MNGRSAILFIDCVAFFNKVVTAKDTSIFILNLVSAYGKIFQDSKGTKVRTHSLAFGQTVLLSVTRIKTYLTGSFHAVMHYCGFLIFDRCFR